MPKFRHQLNTHSVKYHLELDSTAVTDSLMYTQIYPDDITNIINEYYVTYIMTYNISNIC